MVTRMFIKMMIYLTIGVLSVNYLIDSRLEIMNYLHPALNASINNIDLDMDMDFDLDMDDEDMLDSHQLLD